MWTSKIRVEFKRSRSASRFAVWAGVLALVILADCATAPPRLSGETIQPPYPHRCLEPASAEDCRWIEEDLGHMIPDGVCGTGQLLTFLHLVELGPFAHPCLAYFLRHATNSKIADNALAVLMSTGCEGSMLGFCAERGEQARCETAQRWHQRLLHSDGTPTWSSALLRVNQQPPQSAMVRIVQLATGAVFYADPAPDGQFAIPFEVPGRYRVTAFLGENRDEDRAPKLEFAIDELPGPFRAAKRFGDHLVEVTVWRAKLR